jgi:hypothetical protein
MPTYISLLRYTQQGIAAIKQGPARLDKAKEAYKRSGPGQIGFDFGRPRGTSGRRRSAPSPSPSIAGSLPTCPDTVSPELTVATFGASMAPVPQVCPIVDY